jgi:hypothetical protein
MKNLLGCLALLYVFANCQNQQSASNTNQSNAAQPTSQVVTSDTNTSQNTAQTTPSVSEAQVGVTAAKPAPTTNVIPSQSTDSKTKSGQNLLNDLSLDAAQLYKGFMPKSQAFEFKGTESDIRRVDCKGGTVLIFDPKNFEFEDGTPARGNITLKVTEYLDKSEMILSPLSTVTDDNRPLESAGMVHTYAYSQGKMLRLKQGEKMKIGFRVTDEEKFQLFEGTPQTGTNTVSWLLTKDPNPISQIVFNKVDKPAKFYKNDLEEHLTVEIRRTPAMKSYQAQGFDIAAILTFDKLGKIVDARLAESKTTYSEMGIDTAYLGVFKRMKNWSPAFKNGKPVRSRQLVAFNFSGFRDESAVMRHITAEAYAKSMHVTLERLLTLPDDDLLTFPTVRLGWINCDRFYNDPRPKASLLVNVGNEAANVKVVLKKMKAIMGTNLSRDRLFYSPSLPIGELVNVVAIKKVDEQYYFAMQETTVDNKTISLSFTPVSENDLKEKIQDLAK